MGSSDMSTLISQTTSANFQKTTKAIVRRTHGHQISHTLTCKICVKYSSKFFGKRLLALSWLSVRPHGTTQLPQDGFSKFDICVFLENLSRKFKFQSNLTRVTCTFNEDVSTLRPIIPRSMLLRMRNVSDKIYRENQNRFYVLLDRKWDLV